MNVCTHKVGTVTLVDGSIVASDSEAWRAECEARAVLLMRTKGMRYAWLNHIEARRGKEARERLHADVLRVWRLSRLGGEESR